MLMNYMYYAKRDTTSFDSNSKIENFTLSLSLCVCVSLPFSRPIKNEIGDVSFHSILDSKS